MTTKQRYPKDLRPTNSYDWGIDDVFADSGNKNCCRILDWSKSYVYCELWSLNGSSRKTRFSLPETYWTSPACGWRKVKP